jgi:excisionase family DNA binding protein
MSVSEAALRLGVDASRVRALAQSGELPAQLVGHRWVLDEAVVERYGAARPLRRAGRPFKPSAAWALLALAGGREVDWCSRPELERLHGVLASRGIERLVGQLRRRAGVERWAVHSSVLDRLLGAEDVVIGGARAARELARDRGPAELYMRRDDVERHRRRHAPEVNGADHNLLVRVVDQPWPFHDAERRVWPVVAAVDLLDSRPEDPRSRAVAERILRSAHG